MEVAMRSERNSWLLIVANEHRAIGEPPMLNVRIWLHAGDHDVVNDTSPLAERLDK
jgi:hypothetical protein